MADHRTYERRSTDRRGRTRTSRRSTTHSREELLVAAAQASRLLLEAPDAMKRMPEVLRCSVKRRGWIAPRSRSPRSAPTASAGSRSRRSGTRPASPRIEGCSIDNTWNVAPHRLLLHRARSRPQRRAVRRRRCRAPTAASRATRRRARSSCPSSSMANTSASSASTCWHRARIRFRRRLGARDRGEPRRRRAASRAAGRDHASRTRDRRPSSAWRSSPARTPRCARISNASRSQPAEFFDHALLETCRHAQADNATAVVADYASEGWVVGSHACEGRNSTAPFSTICLPPTRYF